MKRGRVTPESACARLEEQIAELDQFRNASTRDPRFKQWRQSALTVIQRIWPGVTARSRRFRRVPFSPPSTLADARLTREAFERGCSEATLLIRGWIAEIQSHGIQIEDSESREGIRHEDAYAGPTLSLDGEVSRAGSNDDLLDHGVPTLDLPPSDASDPATDPGAARTGTKAGSRPQNPPPSRAKAARNLTPKPAPESEKPSKSRRGVTTRSSPSGGTPRGGRLKDLLGLAHLAAATGGKDESKRFEAPAESLPPPDPQTSVDAARVSVPDRPPGDPKPGTADAIFETNAPGPDALVVDPSPWTFPPGASALDPVPGDRPILRPFEGSPLDIPGFREAITPSPGPGPQMPGLRSPQPPLDLAHPAETTESGPSDLDSLDVGDLELTVVDDSEPEPAPAGLRGDAAAVAGIAAIAAEIGGYDVPEGERERVRSVLLDLARAIEAGGPSWEALRAATAVVMHYPKLGRRAMPVLLPLLDRTA